MKAAKFSFSFFRLAILSFATWGVPVLAVEAFNAPDLSGEKLLEVGRCTYGDVARSAYCDQRSRTRIHHELVPVELPVLLENKVGQLERQVLRFPHIDPAEPICMTSVRDIVHRLKREERRCIEERRRLLRQLP